MALTLAGLGTAATRVDQGGTYVEGHLLSEGSAGGTITWTGPQEPRVVKEWNGNAGETVAREYYAKSTVAYYLGQKFDGPFAYEFESAPLPNALHLDPSRLLQFNFVIEGAQWQESGGCSSSYSLDARLYLDGKFIGGLAGTVQGGPQQHKEHKWYVRFDAPKGFCVYSLRAQSEVAEWPAGKRIKLVALQERGTPSFKVALGGEQSSVMRIPVYTDREYAFRMGDDSIPGVSEDAGTGSASPSLVALPGFPAILLLAASASNGRRRSTIVLVSGMVMVSLGGCLGGPSGGGEEANVNDSGIVRGDVDPSYVDDPTAGAGNGSVLGRVRDALERAVPGVRVTLIGTGLHTTTDGQGRFEFANVPVGQYVLRATQEGFKAFETKSPIRVLEAKATFVEVALEATEAPSQGSHSHGEEWGGRSTITLAQDHQVGPSGQSGTFTFGIPASEDPNGFNAVLPGTSLMEVTVRWPEESAIGAVALSYRSIQELDPLSLDMRNTTRLYPRGIGEPFRIPVSWEMTDSGHAQFSLWQFELTTFYEAYAVGWPESLAAKGAFGYYTVTMVIHKGGRPPLEPPHPDHWGANQTLTVFSAEVIGPGCYQIYGYCGEILPGVQLQPESNLTMKPTSVVPPGTEWLEVRANQTGSIMSPKPQWRVFYKDGASPQLGCSAGATRSQIDYWVAKRTAGGPGEEKWAWRIPVTGKHATDPFYAASSSWCFWISSGSTAYEAERYLSSPYASGGLVGERLLLNVDIIAHRTPLSEVP